MIRFALATAVALAGCHSLTVVEETVPVDAFGRRTDTPPRPLEPSAIITDEGNLRFVVPQACETQLYKREQTVEITTVRPNVATMIVGLVVGSLGAVFMATGLASEDTASTVGGAASLGIGLPLVIGPYIGNETRRRNTELKEYPTTTREERCGEVAMSASSGVVTFQDVRVAGLIDDAGVFTIPAFHFIDAFDFVRVRGAVSAVIDDRPESVDWVLDAEQLTPAAAGFFRAQQIDGSIQELDKVPNLSADKFAVALDRGDPYPIALVTVTIRNDGPGTAWGVRARLDSAVPELRNRFLYVGRLGPGKTADPVLAIPLADSNVDLRMSNLTLWLLDAHQTAPNEPLSQPRISSR